VNHSAKRRKTNSNKAVSASSKQDTSVVRRRKTSKKSPHGFVGSNGVTYVRPTQPVNFALALRVMICNHAAGRELITDPEILKVIRSPRKNENTNDYDREMRLIITEKLPHFVEKLKQECRAARKKWSEGAMKEYKANEAEFYKPDNTDSQLRAKVEQVIYRTAGIVMAGGSLTSEMVEKMAVEVCSNNDTE